MQRGAHLLRHQPTRIAALLVLATLLTGACSTMEPDSASTAPDLSGSAWTMSMPTGAAKATEAVPTMRFDDGRVSGSDGCNRFSGPYSSSSGKLQFAAPRVGTMMACPTEDGARMARVFHEALSATRAYRIEGGKLMLLDAGGAVLMRGGVPTGSGRWDPLPGPGGAGLGGARQGKQIVA